VARGLRRVAAKELQSARDELRKTNPPRAEAIHEARKSIKKVRAIVQVIEADHGRKLARSSKRLRKVSHILSRLRDADAMLEMLATLRSRNPDAFNEHSFARARGRLFQLKQASLQAAEDDGAWKKVDRALRKLRRQAKRWRPRHDGLATLSAGIESTYRQGRKALARARTRQRADDFHEWRKHIKALWYQLRLIEDAGRGIRRDLHVLHEAETWLGDDHNVVVLCAELSKDISLCDLERLRHGAVRYQRELRRKAIANTARIFSHTGNEYLRRVNRAWKAWQRGSQSSRARTSRRRAA
jgi:CHAD domain-containing protein